MIDWSKSNTIRIDIFVDTNVFYGQNLHVTEEQYKNIIEMSKSFYESGFEMTLEDGSFIIIPPELTKKSILKITVIQDENDVY
jgi:hypothetical protein